ncbi:hypothetical protein MAM1_0053d03497 [Mucor ambiguus]|uniref:Uncharacterized protein n=1 Tax=Mucor ambiguus TaxID=91626 RepID=A0A0C9M9P5_9FUNG|nr:hypothetical protein MAM1_0053d03497 [Mucor ambiguus]
MAQENVVDYMIPSNVNCSLYFKSKPLPQWNRDDYISYRKENGSFSLPDGKLIEDYNNDLAKLLASEDIPDGSKRVIKSIQPKATRKGKQKSATNSYNTYSQCALSKSGNASITFGETASKVSSDSQEAFTSPCSSSSTVGVGSSMSESEPADSPVTTNYSSQSNHRPIDKLFEDEPLPDTVPKDFRDAVFKAGYHYVNMEPDEKNTLKLSLCHIICFVGATAPIYDHFFSTQDPAIRLLYEAAKADVPKLPTGLTDKARSLMDELFTTASEDENAFHLKLAEKKLEALKGPCDSQEMQILSIIEYVVLCLVRSNQRHKSELSCYRITAFIIELVLGRSPLKIIDGENTSQAMKNAQLENQRSCLDDDDKKRLIGRKIDMIVSGHGVELSSSEWKREQTVLVTIEQQRVKNIRTNCAMLSNIMHLPIDDNSDNITTYGMDWLGMVGCMYAITAFKDIYIAHDAGGLVMSDDIGTLSYLEDTLELLFSFKHHLEDLCKRIKPATGRLKCSNQLAKLYSTSAPNVKRVKAPVVFFSPTKRQKNPNQQ